MMSLHIFGVVVGLLMLLLFDSIHAEDIKISCPKGIMYCLGQAYSEATKQFKAGSEEK